MGVPDITLSLFLSQIANLGITLLWLALVGLSLWSLRRQDLSDVAKALWAALVIMIPFLGSIAFWVVVPKQSLRRPILAGNRQLPAPIYREAQGTGVDVKGVALGQAIHGSSPT